MTAQTLYLAMVLAGFGTFMVTLASVNIYLILGRRAAARTKAAPPRVDYAPLAAAAHA